LIWAGFVASVATDPAQMLERRSNQGIDV
jgi:hypothetical protein